MQYVLHLSWLALKKDYSGVLCNNILSNDSIRPAKLKKHLNNIHLYSKDKDKTLNDTAKL